MKGSPSSYRWVLPALTSCQGQSWRSSADSVCLFRLPVGWSRPVISCSLFPGIASPSPASHAVPIPEHFQPAASPTENTANIHLSNTSFLWIICQFAKIVPQHLSDMHWETVGSTNRLNVISIKLMKRTTWFPQWSHTGRLNYMKEWSQNRTLQNSRGSRNPDRSGNTKNNRHGESSNKKERSHSKGHTYIKNGFLWVRSLAAGQNCGKHSQSLVSFLLQSKTYLSETAFYIKDCLHVLWTDLLYIDLTGFVLLCHPLVDVLRSRPGVATLQWVPEPHTRMLVAKTLLLLWPVLIRPQIKRGHNDYFTSAN